MLATTRFKKQAVKFPPFQDDLIAIFDPAISLNDIHPEEREIRTIQQGRNVTFSTAEFQIAHSAQLSFEYNQPFTISFKLATTSTAAQQIGKRDASSRGISITTTNSTVTAFIGSSATNRISISYSGVVVGSPVGLSLIDGVEYTYTMVYNGNGLASGVTMYIGQYQMSIGTVNADNLSSNTIVNTQPWRSSLSGSSNKVVGSLQDFRIYNVAKSASDILDIINFKTSPTGLKCKLNFDEQSGTTLYNSWKSASDISTYGQTCGDGLLVGAGLTYTTQNNYSFQNNYGYNTSGSVLIPRNLAVSGRGAIGVDATGATLLKFKPVRYRITVTSGVINFNPDNAPMSKAKSDDYPFTAYPTLPTSYNPGTSTIAWGTITDPYYADKKGAIEKNYLIYRTKKTLAEKGLILNFLRKITILVRIWGQSNATGTNNLASDLPTYGYTTTVANALVWNNNVSGVSLPGSVFVTLRSASDGTNTCGGVQVGPEISLLSDLVANQTNEVFLVKYAVGATSLNNDGFPYWLPTPTTDPGYPASGSNGELYPNLYSTFKIATDYVKSTLNRGNDLIIIDVFDQGENDCTSTDSPLYQSNLTTLYNAMCWQLNSTYIIQRLISSKETASNSTYKVVVNAGKTTFAAKSSTNRFTFPSESVNYVVGPDNAHLTTQGQVQSGKDAADKIINTILPSIP